MLVNAPPEFPPIGYLVPEFPSQTHAFFWREVRGMREAGQEVHLLSTRRPSDDACRHEWAEEARTETTYVHPPRWFSAVGWMIGHPVQTVKALRYVAGLKETRFSERMKILGMALPAAELARTSVELGLTHVHVHSCANAAHLAALAHCLGAPRYSLTLHGDLPVYGTDHASKMGGATFVSTVTRPLQGQVTEQVGLPSERVPVIWMGVDTQHFRPPAQPRRKPRGKPLVLSTIARLNETKGHVHALRALRVALDEGCELEYRIAGEGPHRNEIEAEIERLGLEDHVTLLGSISEEEVRGLLDASHAFCLPSFGLGEAAPVSVMEAMACGLPVICSIIGGTRDMIDHDVDGLLCEQQDEEALAEAFTRIAREPATRRRLGQAARDRAVDEFDYRRVSFRLLGEIRSAAA